MTTSPRFTTSTQTGTADSQLQKLTLQNTSLAGRITQLEKQKEMMVIEASQRLSNQSKSYLQQMELQQAAHERTVIASTQAFNDLKAQSFAFEQETQRQIELLKRQLENAVQERNFMATQLQNLSTQLDSSEIGMNLLRKDLEESEGKVLRLTSSLEKAVQQGNEVSAKLRQELQLRTTLQTDCQSQKERFERHIFEIDQELQTVRTERNTLAAQLPVALERGRELEIQLGTETERRKRLEAREEELSQLRLKAQLLRTQSERMNMRNPLCRTTLDKTAQMANAINELLGNQEYAYRKVYLRFQKVEEAIREVNLAIYRRKARPEEADFFAIGQEDLNQNRVKEFGLDPYLLILGAESHFGPRNLTSEQFKLINEPVTFASLAEPPV